MPHRLTPSWPPLGPPCLASLAGLMPANSKCDMLRAMTANSCMELQLSPTTPSCYAASLHCLSEPRHLCRRHPQAFTGWSLLYVPSYLQTTALNAFHVSVCTALDLMPHFPPLVTQVEAEGKGWRCACGEKGRGGSAGGGTCILKSTTLPF